MKIINIFADQIFAFQLDGNAEDEFHRNLNLWNDVEYLKNYFEKNKSFIIGNSFLNIGGIRDFIYQVSDNAQDLDEIIEMSFENGNLHEFFIVLNEKQPLHETYSDVKAKQKFLRLYGIKMEDDTFIITGGAIKITRSMQEHEDTQKELEKFEFCKQFLKENDITNDEQLYEYLKINND